MELLIILDNIRFYGYGGNKRKARCVLCQEPVPTGKAWHGSREYRSARHVYKSNRIGFVCQACVDNALSRYQDIYQVPSRQGNRFTLSVEYLPNLTMTEAKEKLYQLIAEKEKEKIC